MCVFLKEKYLLVQNRYVFNVYVISISIRMARVQMLTSVMDTIHVDMPAIVLTQWAALRKKSYTYVTWTFTFLPYIFIFI